MPTYTVDYPNEVWTKEKNVTMKYPTGEGLIYQYSTDGGKSWTSEKSKTYTSNQTVNIWVKDNVGNVNKQTVTINKIDDSAPTNVTVKESGVTSSSITVTASATQSGAGIKGYQFSINNGVWTSEQTSVTKTFTGLTKNTSYQVKVRAIAHNGKYTDSSNITVKTNDISVPTYNVVDDGPNLTKEVTINYGGTKTSNLVYEYSLDGGSSWKTVSGTSQKLTFTENGTVIVRVRDTGNTNNTVTASTLTIQFPINMLKSGLRLGNLTSIEFVNDIAPEGTNYIDVSEAQNGSIQLWNNGLNSYIGSTKKIYGKTDSSYLFTSTSTLVSSNLETINFNDYFDTSKVTNMSYMFSNAYQLTSLDLSKWNTSSLIAFGDMFDCCDKLNVSIKLNGIQWFEFTMQNYSFYGSRSPISITIYGDGTNESEILEMIN